jgi:hypothetical protein
MELAPDPLATDMLKLSVSGLQIPGTNLANVAFDDGREKITGLSPDHLRAVSAGSPAGLPAGGPAGGPARACRRRAAPLCART